MASLVRATGFPSWLIDPPSPPLMAKLVFDIESSALPRENFDEGQQEYLFREAEKIADAVARETRRGEILQQFNLWPFTAQVVCIAMLNADAARGQVLFTADDHEV